MSEVAKGGGGAEVAVVVPVHNRARVTERFLAALAVQDGVTFRTVVVDAGSTDDTAAVLRDAPLQVDTVHGDASWFWGHAAANGVAHVERLAIAPAVLLLNDDVELTPGYLRAIVDAGRANPNAMIGSTIVDARAPHGIYFAGGVFRPGLGRYVHLRKHDRRVDWLTGMGMWMAVATWRRVGGIDWERFPHYGGDFELSYRAGRAGTALLMAKDAVLRIDVDRCGRKIPAELSWPAFARALFDDRFDESLPWRVRLYHKHFGVAAAVYAALRFAADVAARRGLRRVRALWS